MTRLKSLHDLFRPWVYSCKQLFQSYELKSKYTFQYKSVNYEIYTAVQKLIDIFVWLILFIQQNSNDSNDEV